MINITWVFFRADSFGKAWLILNGMFGMNGKAEPILPTAHLVIVSVIIIGIVFAHWRMRQQTLEAAIAKVPAVVLSSVWAVMAFAVVIAQGAGNAFIYFQF